VATASAETPYDDVVEQATSALERAQVRRCLHGLTDLQREAILLAYYGGHTYPQVAKLLGVALPTIKTRMRDGLIRLRDCLVVAG
jgi:RNA polymerase sigma-70 factor, ECF subfamily